MTTIVIFVLALSLILYVVLGGADFGAGMTEFVHRRESKSTHQSLINHALAPVWETNHIWIILAVVLLFAGFPKAYAQISITFHLPLLVFLFGIVTRGSAFAFRYYHPEQANRSFTILFVIGSFLAPLAAGVVVGSLLLGRIPEHPTDFVSAYVLPWCNLFSFSVGFFMCSLCLFLAAVFLIGEAHEPTIQKLYLKLAKRMSVVVLGVGVGVFCVAELVDFHLMHEFFTHPISVAAFSLAMIILLLIYMNLQRETLVRYLAGAFVAFVLIGWFSIAFPFIIGGHPYAHTSLNLYDASAPAATMRQLLIALAVGLCLIVPSIWYLFYVFKRPTQRS